MNEKNLSEKELLEKEKILKAREEELKKRESQLQKKQEEVSKRNVKENFYENFRNIPVKYLDILIGVCGVAILVCVILGMLQGRGII